MVRKVDCQKYKAWKKQQAKNLKQTKKRVKKRKQKDLTTDCVDEDELESGTKPVTKISYRKCKKKRKKKKKKPSRLIRKIVKYISMGELVMKCIKPSVEDRQYVLSPRHNVCIGLSESEVNFALEGLRTPASRLFYMPKRRTLRQGMKPCRRKKADEPVSDDSECDSICSFDSDICLAGVRLTAKDKEDIKKFQREAQEAGEKEVVPS